MDWLGGMLILVLSSLKKTRGFNWGPPTSTRLSVRCAKVHCEPFKEGARKWFYRHAWNYPAEKSLKLMRHSMWVHACSGDKMGAWRWAPVLLQSPRQSVCTVSQGLQQWHPIWGRSHLDQVEMGLTICFPREHDYDFLYTEEQLPVPFQPSALQHLSCSQSPRRHLLS